jgi:hypothetical protein
MTDLRKAAEMALEALEMTKVVFEAEGKDYGLSRVGKAIEALSQALAQPVDAVNMSQKRVDETAKRKHKPGR